MEQRAGARNYLGGRTRTNVCGVCGRFGKMTRAHVPPQAAGNTGAVLRYRPSILDGGLGANGREKLGGLYVESLCAECNNVRAGAKRDPAYADFAQRMERALGTSLVLPGPVPPINVAPGLVSRSVLIGLMAVNPRLREQYPSLAEQMVEDRPGIRLPGGLQLRLALTRQREARLAAQASLSRVMIARAYYHAFAELWFRPFAWALVPQTGRAPTQLGPELVAEQRWADVTEWLRYSEDRTSVDLRNLVPHLPQVTHPLDGPDHDNWMSLLGDAPLLQGYLS